jgi:hypothetical protein
MNEEQANAVAQALGGNAWNSGGNIWLVRVQKEQGDMVVISDDVVCEYENEDAFSDSKPTASILLH